MSDLIDRQAAIAALGDIHPLDYNAQAYKARIEKLPSAQPTQTNAPNALETSDCVSRQAAIDALACLDDYEEEEIETLRKLPSAQPTQKNDSNTLNALDCVSRQAAIDAIDSYEVDAPDYMQGWAVKLIEAIKGDIRGLISELPSAQPEYCLDEWCTKCKEYDHERHCCPRFNHVIRTTLQEVKEVQE